jgi:DNA-binding response OmpR family regulator
MIDNMPSNPEKILVIENDPDISDLITRQALASVGYQTRIATDGSSAIRDAVQFQPDLIIADINLPGLSGKDLLVAFVSQGINIPVIILANKGQEHDVIQAFRLGATDYLILPAREAEVVAAVERVIKQVREARARKLLDAQLKEANNELQRRVRELTTIFSIGRAVVSITEQRVLFEKIVEAAVTTAEADMGWFLLRDDKSKAFVLTTHRNLPEAWSKKVGQPLDDGVGALVAMSGQSLEIHGDPLKQFKVAAMGQAAMVVPIKAQNQTIGLLTLLRKTNRPFDKSALTLVEAITDYASISLVNAQLFKALGQNLEAAQAGEKRKREILDNLRKEIQVSAQSASYPIDLMIAGQMGTIGDQQKQALTSIKASLQRLLFIAEQQATQPISKS